MQDRVEKELQLLKARFAFEYQPIGQWVRILRYPLPAGWSIESTDLVFQVPVQYPAAPPYGIYAQVGLRFNGQIPGSYSEPAPTQPPFPGKWAIFSWTPADGNWYAAADISDGSNLLNWIVGFRERFREGA